MKMIKTTALILMAFTGSALADGFSVSVPAAVDGKFAEAQYANAFGCDGGNVSPAIEWTGVPAGTKSIVVSVYDPDAPTDSGFWHWVVANIAPTATGLAEGAGNGKAALPEGAVQVTNDAGAAGFLGACPPEGQDHRYVVSVKAFGIDKIDVSENTTPAVIGFIANANSIGKAMTEIHAAR